MRQGDDLFFAPGVRFSEVDLTGPALTKQYRARIEGLYLGPARLCIDQNYAFAAGLLLVSTIDFMAGLHHFRGVLSRPGGRCRLPPLRAQGTAELCLRRPHAEAV